MVNTNRENILIVDDEPTIRRLLRRKLVESGYECLEAGDAKQALDKLKDTMVSVVILDITMPGKPGTELLPQIKAGYPEAAVIMATATTDINTAIQCMKQGAYDYITKPFNLDDVVLSIGRALERKKLELTIREYRQHLEEKIEEQAGRIRASFLNAIRALAYALEAKDKYTSGHSQRVADISVAIAKELGLPKESVDKIVLAGLVHDIGKIGIPEFILKKPHPLSEEEIQQIQRHPEIGERILAPIAGDEQILEVIRSHHSHFDGTGYPGGLKGYQIPLGARILAIADAFEAMTSARPYREAISDEEAFSEIERGKGTQFDPEVVEAFLKTRKVMASILATNERQRA